MRLYRTEEKYLSYKHNKKGAFLFFPTAFQSQSDLLELSTNEQHLMEYRNAKVSSSNIYAFPLSAWSFEVRY